jgi:heme/copper-type cytochrome/quinol oxidase subunit 4
MKTVMKNSEMQWFERLNEIRQPKGSMPAKMFWRFIIIVCAIWGIVWLMIYLTLNSK